MKYLVLMMTLVLSTGALATEAGKAQRSFGEKINFNKLINSSLEEKKELQADSSKETLKIQKQRKIVVDFYDLELGTGDAPKLVDRRYK